MLSSGVTDVEMPEKLTIVDIARKAGVSIRTVSRVLNDSPFVNAETRDRIKSIIESTSYSPNSRARGLASNRSYLIGLVHDDPNGLVLDQVQRGIVDVCAAHAYELVVHPCNLKARDLIPQVLQFARRSRVDGIVVLPPVSENGALAQAIHAAGLPAAGIASVPVEDFPLMIVVNERSASAQVASMFYGKGHTEVGFVSGPLDYRSAEERRRGFLDAFERFGAPLAEDKIAEGDYSFQSGFDAGYQLISRNPSISAIFASNDRMAAGVLKAAFKLNRRVPHDLAVVGFDDSDVAGMLTPALSSVARPMRQLGSEAAKWLIDTAGVISKHETRHIDLQIILRESLP